MSEVLLEGVRCRRGSFLLEVDRLLVGSGEKVAVLGENGSGKSTLLMVMAGFLKGEGRVKIGGMDVQGMLAEERAKRVVYLPQRVDLAFNYTVFQVVLMGRYAYTEGLRPAKEDVERTEGVLRELGLWEMRGRGVLELSGGEQRRVFLAKVLNQGSDVLLLDEPTEMMDVRNAKLVLERIVRLSQTVVAVFHDVNLALRFFNRFLFLKNGRLVADVGREQVDEDLLRFVYDTDVKRGEAFLFY